MSFPVTGVSHFSLLEVVGFVALAWISGILFGYALPRRRAVVRATPSDEAAGRPAEPLRRVAEGRGGRGGRISLKARRRKRSSYYFSEETRSWRDPRWTRRLAWVSAVLIMMSLATAGAVAIANYKARPNAAAGYRG